MEFVVVMSEGDDAWLPAPENCGVNPNSPTGNSTAPKCLHKSKADNFKETNICKRVFTFISNLTLLFLLETLCVRAMFPREIAEDEEPLIMLVITLKTLTEKYIG